MTKTYLSCDCPICGHPAVQEHRKEDGGTATVACCFNCGNDTETYWESDAEAADTRRELAEEDARAAAWERAKGGGK